MKTLSFASAIVAGVGLLCFAILSLLHLPDQVPAYLSSVIVGALPMVHQELEKRTGRRALVAQEWAPPSQPPSATASPSYPPGYGPPDASPALQSAVSAARFSIPSAGSGQPSPVYFPLSDQTPLFQSGEPVPVYDSMGQARFATIAPRKSFFIRWQVMLVYGVALVTALRQLSGLLAITIVPQSDDVGTYLNDFLNANLLILLFIDTVVIFFIGRWIGRRADANTFQAVIGMTALGLLAAYFLDFVFAPEVAAEAGLAGYAQGFVFQMVILCPCALAGLWLGRRTRPALAA